MSEITLSQMCKSYGFKDAKTAADTIGVHRTTLNNWFNDDHMRTSVLQPALQRHFDRISRFEVTEHE